jgi:GTPase SAR1 family protein
VAEKVKVKVTLAGEINAGKTALIVREVLGTFTEGYN